jgi:hypothetical protein
MVANASPGRAEGVQNWPQPEVAEGARHFRITTQHPGCAMSQQKREEAHRGTVRLGQDHRWACTANPAGGQEARLQVHPDNGRRQPDQAAKARGRMSTTGAADLGNQRYIRLERQTSELASKAGYSSEISKFRRPALGLRRRDRIVPFVKTRPKRNDRGTR